MKSHLVGFGCSWIHGDEIDHPTASPGTKEHRVYRESNCFLGQLGAQLGMTVENYGISGSSLQSTLWEFARWAQSCEDTSRYLVVIGLTDDARTSWWNGPNRNNAKYGGDYADRFLANPAEHTQFSADWSITKEGRRAIVYPMLAIEDGLSKYDDDSQRVFHRLSHEAHKGASTYI